MKEYVPLKKYAQCMGMKKNDIVFISSDSTIMLYDAMYNNSSCDLNDFLDGIIDVVGDGGTIIIPTFNWDYCKGVAFDYKNTPCKTGMIGTVALRRQDFKRTKHPIYSFAVFGRFQDYLCSLENKDSFADDSPFGFFKRMNVKNYIIDVSLKNCFTYVHYVEESSKMVKYRFVKTFTGDYIDENGLKTKTNYSMFVRDLNLNVENIIDPFDLIFEKNGIERLITINNSTIRIIELGKAFDLILNDIKNNSSKTICSFKKQQ